MGRRRTQTSTFRPQTTGLKKRAEVVKEELMETATEETQEGGNRTNHTLQQLRTTFDSPSYLGTPSP